MIAKTPESPHCLVSVFVSAFECWIEGESSDTPSVQFIEAMQRRRLSPLAKASLSVMHRCAQGEAAYPVVYASRHGELARTMALLNQMAVNDMVSPMGFSLAVLNATAGLYSIAVGSQAACSAVSAGEKTFDMGLLEASMQAHATCSPVLYVYADEPLPAVYGAGVPIPLHAMAMRVYSQPAEGRTEVQCVRTTTKVQTENALPQALLFAKAWALAGGQSGAHDARVLTWSFL
jgi:hypothetical protein